MRMCEDHWAKLRYEVEQRGLNQFISKNGEEALARTVAELEKRPTKATFDPLMFAHNAIVANAMDTHGLAIMEANDDGTDRCPLCYLMSVCTCGLGYDCGYQAWPSHAAEDALEYAKELGLVGSA